MTAAVRAHQPRGVPVGGQFMVEAAAESGTALVAEMADEDRCPCGGPLDNGEGYDGKCGSCADVAEEAGTWE